MLVNRSLLALSLTLVACGPAADDAMEEEGFVLLQPKLDSIAPSAITLGETVTVVGADFIAPEDGTLALLLDGDYVDSEGQSHPFEGEIELRVLNASKKELLDDAEGVELIRQPRNLGLAMGRNRLWREARDRGFPVVE